MRATLTRMALLVAVLTCAGSIWAQGSPQMKARHSMLGKTAPQLAVNKWVHTNGKALSLKSLRGKVVVLDFFTFW